MEGIFILRIIGDTNLLKITNNPDNEMKEILNDFSNKGYPFSKFEFLKAYKILDTVIVEYKFQKNFIYIVKSLVFENYYSKTFIYKKFFSDYKNKVLNKKEIEYKLKKLDEFYNLKSSIFIEKDFIKFQNDKFPLNGFGGITIIDSSINGNLNFQFDFLNVVYNKNFLNFGIEFPFPIKILNNFGLRYYKILNYNNFESFLNLNYYFFGLRILDEKLGFFMGYNNYILNVRLDGINYFYKLFFRFDYKVFDFEFSINQIDKNVIGGINSILGYIDNSIICNNYAFITLKPKIFIIYPMFQTYWIDKSKSLYSYGIGIGNENIKLFFIINGRERKPYLHFIIKS